MHDPFSFSEEQWDIDESDRMQIEALLEVNGFGCITKLNVFSCNTDGDHKYLVFATEEDSLCGDLLLLVLGNRQKLFKIRSGVDEGEISYGQFDWKPEEDLLIFFTFYLPKQEYLMWIVQYRSELTFSVLIRSADYDYDYEAKRIVEDADSKEKPEYSVFRFGAEKKLIRPEYRKTIEGGPLGRVNKRMIPEDLLLEMNELLEEIGWQEREE